jgi:hypothetical protein
VIIYKNNNLSEFLSEKELNGSHSRPTEYYQGITEDGFIKLGSTTDKVLRTINRWFSKPGPTRSLELAVLGEYCRDETSQFINNRISRKWSPFRQVFTPILETSSPPQFSLPQSLTPRKP